MADDTDEDLGLAYDLRRDRRIKTFGDLQTLEDYHASGQTPSDEITNRLVGVVLNTTERISDLLDEIAELLKDREMAKLARDAAKDIRGTRDGL